MAVVCAHASLELYQPLSCTWQFLVLHGAGRAVLATPRNQNNGKSSRRKLQEAVQTTRNQTKRHPDKTTHIQTQSASSLHTRRMHTVMCPNALDHQQAGHTVPALTNRHTPPRVVMK